MSNGREGLFEPHPERVGVELVRGRAVSVADVVSMDGDGLSLVLGGGIFVRGLDPDDTDNLGREKMLNDMIAIERSSVARYVGGVWIPTPERGRPELPQEIAFLSLRPVGAGYEAGLWVFRPIA